MSTKAQIPPTPSLSPLAEVVLEFEESDPEACGLLRPFKADLNSGELEVRARRQFPMKNAPDRAATVARALELLELAQVSTPKTDRRIPASPIERSRYRVLLAEAIQENPTLGIREGLIFLNGQPGVEVGYSSFYSTYWKPALDLVPKEVLERREQLNALRPGTGKVETTDRQRAQVRALVAELKRDHPEMQPAEIMDEVRKRTKIPFRDPHGFRRHYVQGVEPAPPSQQRKRTSRAVEVQGIMRTGGAEQVTDTPTSVAPLPAEPATVHSPSQEAMRSRDLVCSILEPLSPARLEQAEDGLVRVVIESRCITVGDAHRWVARIHMMLAELEPDLVT
jgi:hypothetical protein